MLLRHAVLRLRQRRTKKLAEIEAMRSRVAEQLRSGRVDVARVHVVQVIYEDRHVEMLNRLEVFCEGLQARLPLLLGGLRLKSVAPELRETTATLFVCAPHAGVDELRQMRDLFSAWFGPRFAADAPAAVKPRLLAALERAVPEAALIQYYLDTIANKFGVDWTRPAAAEAASPLPPRPPTPPRTARADLPVADAPSSSSASAAPDDLDEIEAQWSQIESLHSRAADGLGPVLVDAADRSLAPLDGLLARLDAVHLGSKPAAADGSHTLELSGCLQGVLDSLRLLVDSRGASDAAAEVTEKLERAVALLPVAAAPEARDAMRDLIVASKQAALSAQQLGLRPDDPALLASLPRELERAALLCQTLRSALPAVQQPPLMLWPDTAPPLPAAVGARSRAGDAVGRRLDEFAPVQVATAAATERTFAAAARALATARQLMDEGAADRAAAKIAAAHAVALDAVALAAGGSADRSTALQQAAVRVTAAFRALLSVTSPSAVAPAIAAIEAELAAARQGGGAAAEAPASPDAESAVLLEMVSSVASVNSSASEVSRLLEAAPTRPAAPVLHCTVDVLRHATMVATSTYAGARQAAAAGAPYTRAVSAEAAALSQSAAELARCAVELAGVGDDDAAMAERARCLVVAAAENIGVRCARMRTTLRIQADRISPEAMVQLDKHVGACEASARGVHEAHLALLGAGAAAAGGAAGGRPLASVQARSEELEVAARILQHELDLERLRAQLTRVRGIGGSGSDGDGAS